MAEIEKNKDNAKNTYGYYLSVKVEEEINKISSKNNISKSEIAEFIFRKFLGLKTEHLRIKNIKLT